MTNLVKRLRKGVATEGSWREHTFDGLMLETADEIERLTALLDGEWQTDKTPAHSGPLKACPFCGNKALGPIFIAPGNCYRVECMNHCISMYRSTADFVVGAWNHRHNEPVYLGIDYGKEPSQGIDCSISFEIEEGDIDFCYPFALFDRKDLDVYVDDVLQSEGFTINISGSFVGGNVLFVDPPNKPVKLQRNIKNKELSLPLKTKSKLMGPKKC